MVSFKTRSSHVRTFEACNRKWALNELFGQPDPDTAPKSFGTKAHRHREEWLRDSKLPDTSKEGLAAQRGLQFLPAPGKGLLVEHAIEKPLTGSLEGVVFTGAIDLADLRPTKLLLRSEATGRSLRLYDYKFTVALKWAKTSDELARDVSAVTYAMTVRELTRQAGAEETDVPARWLYGERESTRVRPVDFVITRENQRERWAQTLDSVGQMKRHADQAGGTDGLKWQDVEPNYEACGSYGGCPFRQQCAAARLKAIGIDQVAIDAALDRDFAKKKPGNEPKESRLVGMLDALRKGQAIGDKVTAPQTQSAAPQQQVQKTSALASLLGRKATPVPAAIPTIEQVSDLVNPFVKPKDGWEAVDQFIEENQGLMSDLTETENMTPLPAMADVPLNVGVVPPDAPPPDLQLDTVAKKTRKKREKKLDGGADASADASAIAEAAPGETIAGEFVTLTYGPEVQKAAQDAVASMKTIDVPTEIAAATRAAFVENMAKKLRARAETLAGDRNDRYATEKALELFVVANAIERGEF